MAEKENDLIAYNYSLFDKDHFRIVKGISILVMLAAYICSKMLGFRWFSLVTGAVGAVFVFCSGYGVSESYIFKRGLPHFWENKFLKVWVPSLVVMTLASAASGKGLIYWFTSSVLGLNGDILYLIFGAYAAFWLAFKLLDKRIVRIVVLFLSAIVAYFLVEDKILNCVMFAFPVGVLFSQYGFRRKIRKFTWKGHLLLTILLAIPTAAGWFAALKFGTYAYFGNLIWNVTFILSAILLLMLVYYGRNLQVLGLLAPVGTISYALYLCYEDVFQLLMKGKDPKTLIIVLAMLALIASLLTWLRYLLIVWNKNLRRRRRTHIKGRM